MNGKLRIIGIVIMGGFFLLLFNYLNLIPEAPDVVDTIKQDLTDFTKKLEMVWMTPWIILFL